MQIQHLEHRHGGRITELTAIAHDTYQRRASWHFIGTVEWESGKVGEEVEISPVCLCRDATDEAANAELDTAMSALNDYLARHGKWAGMAWKPQAKRGQEALA